MGERDRNPRKDRKFGDPGLVAEIVVERVIGVAGMIAKVFLRLLEAPIDRLVGKPSVIGHIEIGRDVLDIPAQMIGEKRASSRRGARAPGDCGLPREPRQR